MFWKILRFVAFLAAYGGWLWYIGRYFTNLQRNAAKEQRWWATLLASGVSFGGFVLFVWLLSGFFDLRVFGLLVTGSLAGGVFVWVLRGLFGRTEPNSQARVFTAGVEFANRKRLAMVTVTVVSLLVSIAFPIASGISYFSSPAEELARRAFQCTLLFFLASQLFAVVYLPSIVASPNLDAETRLHFLIGQIGALIPFALYLSLLFWSWNLTGTGISWDLGGLSITLSPVLIAVLVCYFVGVVLIPHLVGTQQYKNQVTTLLEKRKDWIDRFVAIVETPVGSLYENKLTELQAEFIKERDSWVASDAWVRDAVSGLQGSASPSFQPAFEPFLVSRHLDPRFRYLDWIEEFSIKIDEVRADLQKRRGEKAKEKDAKEWAEFFTKRTLKLDEEMKASSNTKAPVFLALGGIGAPLLSAIVGKLGEWVWTVFAASLS